MLTKSVGCWRALRRGCASAASIGHEGELGDPLFVDLSVESLPLFVAEHGMGAWNQQPLGVSLLSATT